MLIWVPGVERRVNQKVRLQPVSITCANFTHELLTTCTVCSVILCQRFYVQESSMWLYMLWSHYTKARISSPIVNFCQCVDGLFLLSILLSICLLCSGDHSFLIV
jgi:hypothetical protein